MIKNIDASQYHTTCGHARGVAPYFEICILKFLGHSVHNGSPWSNRLSSDQQISGGCGETLSVPDNTYIKLNGSSM